MLQYTDNQVRDLLRLRRFLYCKLGQLARQRRAVLNKMTWTHVDSCHPSDKLSKLSEWATQLQENGSAEYRTYMIWSIAIFRGVRALEFQQCVPRSQWGTCLVFVFIACLVTTCLVPFVT